MPALPPGVADLGDVVVNAMRQDYSNLWLSLTNNGTTPNPPNNQGQLMMQLNSFFSGQVGAATTAKNYVATHLTIDPNLDLNNPDVKEALRAVKDGLEATAYRALLRPLDKANGPGLNDLTGQQVWDALQRTDVFFSANGPANPIPGARPGTQAGEVAYSGNRFQMTFHMPNLVDFARPPFSTPTQQRPTFVAATTTLFHELGHSQDASRANYNLQWANMVSANPGLSQSAYQIKWPTTPQADAVEGFATAMGQGLAEMSGLAPYYIASDIAGTSTAR